MVRKLERCLKKGAFDPSKKYRHKFHRQRDAFGEIDENFKVLVKNNRHL